MNARTPGPLLRWLLRVPALLYEWNAGWLLGRRSLRYQSAARPEISEDDDLECRHPATEVAVGRQRFRPVHRELDEQEAIAVLADYEPRNRWVTAVVRRVLSWLVGWRYDGSTDARRRLVRQLPVVAFRPHAG